jgi:Zn-dependent M28 family amino/carboxypeptidase
MRTAFFALLMAPCAGTADSAADRWWSHIQYLADDKLEGRNAGSKGHRTAVDYVASKFKEVGLAPCGTSGYLQPVPLVQRAIVEERSTLAILRDGKETALGLGSTAIFGLRLMSGKPAPVSAPAVFAGYGLTIPSHGHDDFSGLDVKGKIVVYMSTSPARLPGPIRAHFSSTAERAKAFRAAGAAGSIAIFPPATSDVPWERVVRSRLTPAMVLDSAGSDDGRGLNLSASVNPAEADLLFEGTGRSAAHLIRLAEEGKALPGFPLAVSIRARAEVKQSRLISDNVCGRLPGTGGEALVLTAHIDHIGTSAAVRGDSINNGAMDNASGIATMIEVARALGASGRKLRRDILFVAVTAEEKGLLGSRYFATHPTIPVETIVANINFDMFLPIHPFRYLMALGLEESTLRGPLEAVAAELGVRVQPDLEPARNRFIRSDQYSFILRGIPALALKIGYLPGSEEEKVQKEWIKTRYHAQGDDLDQPVDRDAAVLFNRFVELLAAQVANAEPRPRWNPSSFFGRLGK